MNMHATINVFVRRMGKICLQFAFLFGGGYLNKDPIHRQKMKYEGVLLDTYVVPVYQGRKGILTIISDDGVYETGIVLNELSQKYNVPITIGGTVTNIGLHETWWKIVLEKNRLLEIVNHSYNHLRMGEGTKVSRKSAWLKHEIIHSQRYFESRFKYKQICFICPENQMCSLGYKNLMKSRVVAVRRGIRGFNDLLPRDGLKAGEMYNLKSIGIMDCDNEERPDLIREGWIQTAINDRKWLIEMWHNVSVEDDEGYQTILLHDAEKHLNTIQKYNNNGSLWVAKFSDVVKYIVEKKYSETIATIEKENLHVSLVVNTIDLSIFNHPITVCVKLPEGVLPLDEENVF